MLRSILSTTTIYGNLKNIEMKDPIFIGPSVGTSSKTLSSVASSVVGGL
jgi:hypothetical protein